MSTRRPARCLPQLISCEIREMTSTIDEDIRLIVERPLRSRKAKVVSLAGAS